MLSEADHARIAAAVAEAEAGTTGEIVCILAREVSNYRETPLALGAAAALLAPPLLLIAGLPAEALTPWVKDWTTGTGAPFAPARLLEAYGVVQVLVFAVVAGLVALPPLRRALTPSSLKRRRVHRAALQQFLATGLHVSEGRTGVVIFASSHDRRVEVLADDAIHKAVGDTVWNAAVKAVQDGMKRGAPADGFVQAVTLCGRALAEHFPSSGPRPNALSNRLREI